jgi:hypothetical protein
VTAPLGQARRPSWWSRIDALPDGERDAFIERLRTALPPVRLRYSPYVPMPKQDAFLRLRAVEAFYGPAPGLPPPPNDPPADVPAEPVPAVLPQPDVRGERGEYPLGVFKPRHPLPLGWSLAQRAIAIHSSGKAVQSSGRPAAVNVRTPTQM